MNIPLKTPMSSGQLPVSHDSSSVAIQNLEDVKVLFGAIELLLRVTSEKAEAAYKGRTGREDPKFRSTAKEISQIYGVISSLVVVGADLTADARTAIQSFLARTGASAGTVKAASDAAAKLQKALADLDSADSALTNILNQSIKNLETLRNTVSVPNLDDDAVSEAKTILSRFVLLKKNDERTRGSL